MISSLQFLFLFRERLLPGVLAFMKLVSKVTHKLLPSVTSWSLSKFSVFCLFPPREHVILAPGPPTSSRVCMEGEPQWPIPQTRLLSPFLEGPLSLGSVPSRLSSASLRRKSPVLRQHPAGSADLP